MSTPSNSTPEDRAKVRNIALAASALVALAIAAWQGAAFFRTEADPKDDAAQQRAAELAAQAATQPAEAEPPLALPPPTPRHGGLAAPK